MLLYGRRHVFLTGPQSPSSSRKLASSVAIAGNPEGNHSCAITPHSQIQSHGFPPVSRPLLHEIFILRMFPSFTAIFRIYYNNDSET
jgi:hypothetical protein